MTISTPTLMDRSFAREISLNRSNLKLMDIIIRTDGVVLDEKLREAVMQKIGRVRLYAPDAFRARVQIQRMTQKPSARQFRVGVLYELRGNDLAAEHYAREPLTAIDLVADKIERRVRKLKTARLARRMQL